MTAPSHALPTIAKQAIVRLSDVHLDMASDAGTVNILRGVTLDIAVGEIAAVVGPSGAGKSSLMMVAGGLERATSGRVEVAGKDLGPRRRRRARCGATTSASSSRASISFRP